MNYAMAILLIMCSLFFQCLLAEASDKENCMMCHKYRFIGRIDDEGKKHNYNVDEFMYNHSVHRNISCGDCHTYIKKIPHDPVTEKVNCANVCHMKPPFSQEKFSHEKIVETFNQSAHGIKASDTKKLKEAQPDCKFCHMNPLFTMISADIVDYDETLRRCFNCHPEFGVTQAYKHFTHRLRKKTSRSPQEIVEICSKCHADTSLMKGLNVSEKVLTAVESYNRSIHGKLVKLGSQKAADCISCHATNALHDIYKHDNKKSTIHEDNIQNTCRQCHSRTDSWFIKVAVHPGKHGEDHPIIHFLSIVLRFAIYGSVLSLVGLMLFETYGRKKNGIKLLFKDGSTWRR
jgi:hypothetical protein